MILDYNYNKSKKILSVSYITENGGKKVLNFNVGRFKTYYSTPVGQYTNWDGAKCDVKYTDNPSTFDIKTYFEEMDPKYKNLLNQKHTPRLYTFDIETEISDEFPNPNQAKYPITTISIANDKCDVIVLGTRGIDEMGLSWINEEFAKYMDDCQFFKSLNLSLPKFQYVKFNSEEEMLEYFLQNIVSKVPILAGWNSILFDWHYIQNRIRGYYPKISLASSSYNSSMSTKNYTDMRDEKVALSMPNHTLILDMMDVVGNFDIVVMPIKESLSLDYISKESIGVNKIKYKGSLQDLYDNDYPRYVFYNAIDSVLVQLIDKRFKTLQNIYTQALYCKEKIGVCFSKIALTEALFFNYFYEKNIKVVSYKEEERHRGVLIGAYVRKPTPGKHDFVCCNDFASLYPSTIITCNMSIENFVGTFYDEEQLLPYKNNKKDYIVVGANVHKNNGTLAKPELGDFIKRCLLEDELDVYRKDKNYFVSVNGSVYKNDKTYAFKDIQATLKANRNTGKYLAKQLEAMVVSDIDHILNGQKITNQQYPENITSTLKSLGYEVDCTEKLNGHNLIALRGILKKEIEFNTSFEQAMKLLGNSMYGGSSHIAFFWFNIALANDITGEARNIIHKMESHIPKYMEEQWPKMKEFHKKYGIEIKPGSKNFLNICYGDTDSVAKDTIITVKDKNGKVSKITIEELYNQNFNNSAGVTLKGHESVSCDYQILNWDSNTLYYGTPKRVIRHKVTKPKWILKTKTGKEIIVTNDHSMIVFRDGEKLEIKPKDILPTDKILIIKD